MMYNAQLKKIDTWLVLWSRVTYEVVTKTDLTHFK